MMMVFKPTVRVRLVAIFLALIVVSAMCIIQTSSSYTGMEESLSPIWPPPEAITQRGDPLAVDVDLKYEVLVQSADFLGSVDASRLYSAAERAISLLRERGLKAPDTEGSKMLTLSNVLLNVGVQKIDGELSIHTKYSYDLEICAESGKAIITAPSVYGAMYGLESLVQLADLESGLFPHGNVVVNDSSSYNWRGLMVDSGRRFFPMHLLDNLLQTMAALKLNVLHLHVSDMCRFGVESKLHPELTGTLTGIHAGHYSQEDIKKLQQTANNLGIRVIPEFDVPGHSRGWRPIKEIDFCTEADTQSQLYGSNTTYDIVHDVLKEMSELFVDEVFNIGCDETAAKGVCDVDTTFAFERRLFQAIAEEFGKTPEGWEEALFVENAATNNTIVNAWTRHTAAEIVSRGYRAVESNERAFYFTEAGPAGAEGWKRCWYDIATGIENETQRKMVLGGEMSMWSDTYCYINQCGSAGSGSPVGAKLFPPEMDDPFSKSIGGMIWPRGFVAAASFWRYNSSADPSSPSFVKAIWDLNDDLSSRGSYTCPTNCSCDQLSACGEPYIAPSYTNGTMSMQQCEIPTTRASGQVFEFSEDGTIKLATNKSLCLVQSASEMYPLQAQVCSSTSNKWIHNVTTGQIIDSNFGECLDVRQSDGVVGTWVCGSSEHLNQPNQHFAVDLQEGLIVSLDTGSRWTGMCATVSSS